jgi:uncharacterized protein YjhX (UPF0386 family)
MGEWVFSLTLKAITNLSAHDRKIFSLQDNHKKNVAKISCNNRDEHVIAIRVRKFARAGWHTFRCPL